MAELFFQPRCIILLPLNDIITKRILSTLTPNEYNQAIDLWADDIFSFAMYCCNDKARCDDAMQEAFAALWEQHDKIELDRCKGFLLTVTQRKLIDSIRHDRKKEPFNDTTTDIEIPTASPIEQIDLRDAIQTAIKQLNYQQRIILTLHDIEGYNYKEIAKMQNMNYNQVQVNVFRARVKLKKVLKQMQIYK